MATNTYTPPLPTIHTVKLPTAESINYTLRSLSNDGDASNWAAFCASIFSYKDDPPTPSYFRRHFYNDPRRDVGLVRVLTFTNKDGEEEIVSSVRIFRRTLTMPATANSIEAGGIGEVCTSPNHQRRGLSKILLNDALQIMMNRNSGMSCSLLHASPTFRPVYAKFGYVCVSSPWSVVPIRLNQLSPELKGPYECTCNGETVDWKVRRAIFPKDTSELHRLHRKYSEDRFITIHRTKEYWNDYVSEELRDTLWVLTKSTDSTEQIIAWMAIRKRGNRYQLREFGCDRSDDFTIAAALRLLLGVTLNQSGEHVGEGVTGDILLHMPTIILIDTEETGGNYSFLDLSNSIEENDDGWMYVNFDTDKENVLELTSQKDVRLTHLIWPTDSF